MASKVTKALKAHREAAVKPQARQNVGLEPLYSEHQTPGREAHIAKCPKCRQIVHIERPLPHGPRSEGFEPMARRMLEKHICGG